MSDSFVTSLTIVCQALLSMEFPREEYWSAVVFSCIEQLQLHATNSSKVSFHFYYVTNILYFSEYKYFVSLDRFISRHCIIFDAMVNVIISIIYFSVLSLLMYRNARNSCV